MCKALKDGGQRCAGHTRAAAHAALEHFNDRGPGALTGADVDAIVDYASTPGGRAELFKRAAECVEGEDLEGMAFFQNALKQGENRREANKELAIALAKARGETVDRKVINEPAVEPDPYTFMPFNRGHDWPNNDSPPPPNSGAAAAELPKPEPATPTKLGLADYELAKHPDSVFFRMEKSGGNPDIARDIIAADIRTMESMPWDKKLEEYQIHDRLQNVLRRKPTMTEYSAATKQAREMGVTVPDRYGRRPPAPAKTAYDNGSQFLSLSPEANKGGVFEGMTTGGDRTLAMEHGAAIVNQYGKDGRIHEWQIHDGLQEVLGRKPTIDEFAVVAQYARSRYYQIPDEYGRRPKTQQEPLEQRR